MNETEIEKLARWWNTLNNWEWPKDLDGKPDGFDEFPEVITDRGKFSPNKFDWTGSIMNRLEKIIGRKESMRWHHIHNLKKIDEEFEEWWNNRDG